MSDLPTIEIPPSLRPADGRFGSGPSKVRQEAVLELVVAAPTLLGTSHRRANVQGIVQTIRDGLGELFSLPDGYEVLLGVGGASAFWDAAAFGLIEERSEHLVFGEFSGKFAGVIQTADHLAEPVVIESPPGTRPDPDPKADVDCFAFTHNETSTGVMMPIVRPRNDTSLVLVDATSAAGGLPVDPHEFDAYYFSPQKAFGADGGLWIALCSPGCIARIERMAAARPRIPPFLSLRTALDRSRNGQTYNTPALVTLFLMQRQIEWMLEMGGLDWAVKRCADSAATLYDWAERSRFAQPFVEKREDRSTTVVTIELDAAVAAVDVSAVLRANGIVDTEGYRKTGGNQLRVATFPNVDPADVELLTEAIDYVVVRL